MIEVVLKILILIGFGGVILGTMGWIMETIQNKSISKLGVNDLSIPKSKFVSLVNEWCWENIKSNNPKPSISVSYNKNKKVSGVYYSFNNSIIVFVNNSPQLIDIVGVVLHEYTHSTQKTKGFDKLYNQYTQEKGYWDNPFEVSSRDSEVKYSPKCLQDLISNNNILKTLRQPNFNCHPGLQVLGQQRS